MEPNRNSGAEKYNTEMKKFSRGSIADLSRQKKDSVNLRIGQLESTQSKEQKEKEQRKMNNT